MGEWNGPKVGFFDDAEKRTRALAAAMNTDYIDVNTELDTCWGGEDDLIIRRGKPMIAIQDIIATAIDTLNKNPKMLKYTFKGETLDGIEVHTHVDLIKQSSVSTREMCTKACKVQAAIQIFIDKVYAPDATDALGKKPWVSMTGKLQELCRQGATGGSSKSKHRPRRHSRNKRKVKVNTHKRRRH